MYEEIKSLTDYIINEIDPFAAGIERLRQMSSILNKLDWKERTVLYNFIQFLAAKMPEIEASDLDIGGESSCGKIWYRIHGYKRPVDGFPIFSADEMDVVILNLLDDSQLQMLWNKRNCDFSYTTEISRTNLQEPVRHRFRADAYFEMGHLALNFRHIPNIIRPFRSYEFHPNVARVMSLAHVKMGLILITGITGSGKSTTLDSIIDANNKSIHAHIVIIASPIETIHQSDKCIVRHREVGRDVLSFKEGAIQALRQDPDIIVIGEMRDPETILTALDITDSGHKVFSTLHTASAVESIDRIIAEVPEIEQTRVRLRLADVLQCIVSQKLVPSTDGTRVLAKEVLVMNSSVRAAIRNNNITEIYQMIHESSAEGMITVEQDLARLVGLRKITPQTALDFANNKKRMQELLLRL
ncbi:MAG: ATPase, T2SS/T4P/T4SS family [bacterium]|nr:ATPase, T2SS/T4P/T4SS family [bacterium]